MIRFDPAYFADHFRFVRWGDEQVALAASALPDEEYFMERGFSHGSIHKLIVHMMAAQWTWLSRFRGTPVKRLEDDRDYPTLAAVRLLWPVLHDEWDAFLKAQTADSLTKPFTHNDFSGKPHTLSLGRLLQHVLDHGTYHRGQFNSMLKMAGGKPLNLSLYPFYEWRGRPAHGL